MPQMGPYSLSFESSRSQPQGYPQEGFCKVIILIFTWLRLVNNSENGELMIELITESTRYWATGDYRSPTVSINKLLYARNWFSWKWSVRSVAATRELALSIRLGLVEKVVNSTLSFRQWFLEDLKHVSSVRTRPSGFTWNSQVMHWREHSKVIWRSQERHC